MWGSDAHPSIGRELGGGRPARQMPGHPRRGELKAALTLPSAAHCLFLLLSAGLEHFIHWSPILLCRRAVIRAARASSCLHTYAQRTSSPADPDSPTGDPLPPPSFPFPAHPWISSPALPLTAARGSRVPEPGPALGTFTRDEAAQGWENEGQLLGGWIHAIATPPYLPLSFPLAGGHSGGELDSARNECMGRTQRCQRGSSLLSPHAGLPSATTATGSWESGCRWTHVATAP